MPLAGIPTVDAAEIISGAATDSAVAALLAMEETDAAAQVQIGQDRRRHVGDPASDRGIALHPGHDRCRG